MKIYYYISVAASALCLVLSVVLFAYGNVNQSLQNELQKQQVELQKQQEEINKGASISQNVGPALLRDMAVASVKNDSMKKLLASHGYQVSMATPAPGSSPAPGASAPAPSAPRATAPASSEPGRLQP
ncbi:MAG TPA: hypothetical protein VK961_01330 [Chthoniobacter sp.]|nr:hypothetical protein [Chthoniobacter sp.]